MAKCLQNWHKQIDSEHPFFYPFGIKQIGDHRKTIISIWNFNTIFILKFRNLPMPPAQLKKIPQQPEQQQQQQPQQLLENSSEIWEHSKPYKIKKFTLNKNQKKPSTTTSTEYIKEIVIGQREFIILTENGLVSHFENKKHLEQLQYLKGVKSIGVRLGPSSSRCESNGKTTAGEFIILKLNSTLQSIFIEIYPSSLSHQQPACEMENNIFISPNDSSSPPPSFSEDNDNINNNNNNINNNNNTSTSSTTIPYINPIQRYDISFSIPSSSLCPCQSTWNESKFTIYEFEFQLNELEFLQSLTKTNKIAINPTTTTNNPTRIFLTINQTFLCLITNEKNSLEFERLETVHICLSTIDYVWKYKMSLFLLLQSSGLIEIIYWCPIVMTIKHQKIIIGYDHDPILTCDYFNNILIFSNGKRIFVNQIQFDADPKDGTNEFQLIELNNYKIRGVIALQISMELECVFLVTENCIFYLIPLSMNVDQPQEQLQLIKPISSSARSGFIELNERLITDLNRTFEYTKYLLRKYSTVRNEITIEQFTISGLALKHNLEFNYGDGNFFLMEDSPIKVDVSFHKTLQFGIREEEQKKLNDYYFIGCSDDEFIQRENSNNQYFIKISMEFLKYKEIFCSGIWNLSIELFKQLPELSPCDSIYQQNSRITIPLTDSSSFNIILCNKQNEYFVIPTIHLELFTNIKIGQDLMYINFKIPMDFSMDFNELLKCSSNNQQSRTINARLKPIKNGNQTNNKRLMNYNKLLINNSMTINRKQFYKMSLPPSASASSIDDIIKIFQTSTKSFYLTEIQNNKIIIKYQQLQNCIPSIIEFDFDCRSVTIQQNHDPVLLYLIKKWIFQQCLIAFGKSTIQLPFTLNSILLENQHSVNELIMKNNANLSSINEEMIELQKITNQCRMIDSFLTFK